MSDKSMPHTRVDTDYQKQIDDVYDKLAIKQKSESVQANSTQSTETPFGAYSYYWFK